MLPVQFYNVTFLHIDMIGFYRTQEMEKVPMMPIFAALRMLLDILAVKILTGIVFLAFPGHEPP